MLTPSFTAQLDQHTLWRRDFALRLKHLSSWLRDNELLDDATSDRLRGLEQQVRSDKVVVAFVAEFSRGKSELINAIFFSGYKRRIMPASAGRTTMCPTELGWDPELPACLRLLPIETRLQPQALSEWRQLPEHWQQIELDVKDPAQLAEALQKVSEVRHVSVDEARELGFWHEDAPEDNPRVDAAGRIEVPRWRHALINIAHPLLKQGLVVLDTPGLNAIGAEPELTVNLIPQAHAVVFILAADAGVSRSDLTIWREHLAVAPGEADSRLVVLNKIDTLWDALSTPEQVEAQIQRQRDTSAEVLGLPASRVIPVSAQKGLLAKVGNDTELLMASRLPELELALAQGTMGQRQRILRSAVTAGLAELRQDVARSLHARRRELAEQRVELKGLRGKNTAVIRHMQSRIELERAEFDESGARLHAVRSIHLKLLRDLTEMLGAAQVRAQVADLATTLRQPGLKLGASRAYAEAFERLRGQLAKAQAASAEIHAMLAAAFRQLNSEQGFSLQVPREPDLSRFGKDLDLIERSHLQYLGVRNMLRMAQPAFAERVVRALTARLRAVYESALGEVEQWNKSAASQLDGQLRERRRNFNRRIEALDRIQQAAAGLDERIVEIESQEATLDQSVRQLAALTSALMDTSAAAEVRPPLERAEAAA
ncbi:dynamin family protein [Ramlibacter rhizophilus]|uniref:Dynamin family protein n=1 Tax=Ramlibacter rhizophilus TaxID=1781167 RepID=A0A4Z0BPA9_9BURK|nr:dynamin family protein [Ramlibacter rhizophilus]TFZ01146.1 dynamin family protein [Ramlibacter rhizophilus]